MRIGAQHRGAIDLRVGAPTAMPGVRCRARIRSLCALFGLTLAVAMSPAVAQDQETVIIGGGPGQGATRAYGTAGNGVTINDEVLDSLGVGPTPDLPYTPEPGVQSFAVEGLPAGTAYRMPGTGQLVVTRPSTLLFPPLQPPRSHLTVTPPAGALAALSEAPSPATMAEADKGTSQLLLRPEELPETPAPSAAPAPEPVVEETLAAGEPVPMPPAAPQPMPEPTPEPTVPSKTPAAPEAPPAPAGLATELQGEPSQAMAVPEPAEQPEAMKPAPDTATAALPPSQEAVGLRRIDFALGSADLTAEAKRTLDGVAAQMQGKKSLRAQLLAYAADSGDGGSQARRLSLSRALAVRAYLIEKGVRSTRLDVRALGSNVPDGPPDRVDIIPQFSG